MEIEKLKEDLKKELQSNNYTLYDCYYTKKDKTLHVEIDESIDLKQIETLSKIVSDFLDKYEDEFEDEYLLDVSSAGIERTIHKEQLPKAVGSYIYVKTKELKVYGDLVSYENGILKLSTQEKNIKKTLEINEADLKFVRYAVKF